MGGRQHKAELRNSSLTRGFRVVRVDFADGVPHSGKVNIGCNPDIADAAVAMEGLTRRFGDLVAVDHLTLRVARGTAFGLLGRNGAGKSITIQMLVTLLPPSEGTAAIAGYDLRAQPRQVRRRIGYAPQRPSADGTLTVWENLMVFARLYHVPRGQRGERIERALTSMGLLKSAHKLVREMSGGMTRRVEIIQSMLHRPDVLFLDEPTTGLDPAARHDIWRGLKDMTAESGTSLFITTHDMEEADTLCDRVVVMRRGAVVRDGSPEQLKAEIGPRATLDDVFIAYSGPAESEVEEAR